MSPTLLYLVTGVLQAAATKAADSLEILADSPPVMAALEALQTLVSMRYVTLGVYFIHICFIRIRIQPVSLS